MICWCFEVDISVFLIKLSKLEQQTLSTVTSQKCVCQFLFELFKCRSSRALVLSKQLLSSSVSLLNFGQVLSSARKNDDWADLNQAMQKQFLCFRVNRSEGRKKLWNNWSIIHFNQLRFTFISNLWTWKTNQSHHLDHEIRRASSSSRRKAHNGLGSPASMRPICLRAYTKIITVKNWTLWEPQSSNKTQFTPSARQKP